MRKPKISAQDTSLLQATSKLYIFLGADGAAALINAIKAGTPTKKLLPVMRPYLARYVNLPVRERNQRHREARESLARMQRQQVNAER